MRIRLRVLIALVRLGAWLNRPIERQPPWRLSRAALWHELALWALVASVMALVLLAIGSALGPPWQR